MSGGEKESAGAAGEQGLGVRGCGEGAVGRQGLGAPGCGEGVVGKIRTGLSAEEVRARLEREARRGKLAGYGDGKGDVLFAVGDFGGPLEGVVEGRDKGEGVLELSWRLKKGMLWVMVVVLAATVWPGVWLTDSMLVTYFPGYSWETWWWYVPLTLPFVPWTLRSVWRKSVRAGRGEAEKIVARVAEVLGGEVV